jgi:hypothetical protein
MPFLTDKCNEIRNWLAIGSDVYSDAIVTGWIRMAEEYLSTALRVKHMIQIDTSVINVNRVLLPRDWLETRFARMLPSGTVCRYQTPDAFFNPEYPDPPVAPYPGRYRKYTVLGNYIMFGDIDEDGEEFELTYYQEIPALIEDTNNWINEHHPIVYTLKILHIASMYAIEDERSPIWSQEVSGLIVGMNAQHKIDMASGSVLMPVRRKSFG